MTPFSTALFVALSCFALQTNSVFAFDKTFEVTPIGAEDLKNITEIFKKLESKWVPAEELTKYPGLYWQAELQKQSFRIKSSQKGLKDVYFVPIQADFAGTTASSSWAQQLSLLILDRNDSKIISLPKHPALQWSFDHIGTIAFRDVQGKGLRSIIVNAAAMTGMGPDGVMPFDVFAIYLPTGEGQWVLDPKLQEVLHEELNIKCKKPSCRTLAFVLKVAKAYFNEKR